MKPTTGKLCDEYAWATEVQLATLSGLLMTKRTSQREITRQTDISLHMLMVCRQHHKEIAWTHGPQHLYGRVSSLFLDAFTEDTCDMPGALERWKEKLRV